MKTRTKQTKVDPSKLAAGSRIAIFVSGGACYTMVSVLSIHGTIVAENEKVIQIAIDDARRWSADGPVTLWIPKSAIVEPAPDEPHVAAYWESVGGRLFPKMFRLASWFKFDAYGQRVLSRIDPAITAINAPVKAG